jgi:hypothetical protein
MAWSNFFRVRKSVWLKVCLVPRVGSASLNYEDLENAGAGKVRSISSM